MSPLDMTAVQQQALPPHLHDNGCCVDDYSDDEITMVSIETIPTTTIITTPSKPCVDKPVFSFGLIADVQYADRDNVEKYTAGKWRYYRTSLDHVRKACTSWNQDGSVRFAVQLGDIIDGYNADVHQSDVALTAALKAFQTYGGCVHHVWGNHELYNFTRQQLHNGPLGHRGDPKTTCPGTAGSRGHYYSFCPVSGYRIILLDTYEVSLLGGSEDRAYATALEVLKKNNPNEDLNCNDGMEPNMQQFVQYNGAISGKQLNWLKATMDDAYRKGEKVIVGGHNPIYAGSSDNSSLCWNSSRILQVLHSYPGTVLAYFSGHDHNGGYAVDAQGIHHITVPGTIETSPQSCSYGTVKVYKNRVEIATPHEGKLKSRVLYPPPTSTTTTAAAPIR